MIPLGYYIVRKSGKKPRPALVSPDYLTVAGCLCEGVIPGLESAPFDGEDIAREWDLSPRDARRLYDFGQEHCMRINYELFHIFLDYDTPACICREFFKGRDDVLIIGLCSNDTHFLESPGISAVAPLPENATLLGWDLYEFGDYVYAPHSADFDDFQPFAMPYGFRCKLLCIVPKLCSLRRNGASSRHF